MATTRNAAQGILADDSAEAREHIIELLKTAYWMEIETPEHQTDIVHVIKGVIEAETGAIEHYNRIVLREYEAEGLA